MPNQIVAGTATQSLYESDRHRPDVVIRNFVVVELYEDHIRYHSIESENSDDPFHFGQGDTLPLGASVANKKPLQRADPD